MNDHEKPGRQPLFDEHSPFDDARSSQQIETLQSLLGPARRRVLDLGCGTGRVLIPLVEAGHLVTGVDHDEQALQDCRSALDARGGQADLIRMDLVRDTWSFEDFDDVLCLGNTMMTFVDVDEAVGVLTRARQSLADGGRFFMDDVPGECWPEVIDGYWMRGTDDENAIQMVWHDTDAIFAVRQGDQIDEDSWEPRSGDRPFRLWSDGALQLAATLAGLSAPARIDGGGLLVMTSARI